MWRRSNENMNTNTDEQKLKERIDQHLPDIKREVVGTPTVKESTVKDSKGKDQPIKEVSTTEREIPNTHLTQIAPMFYYCTDNNKILMIPFSIQFSVTDFLKLAATMSRNLEKLLNLNEEAPADEKPAAK